MLEAAIVEVDVANGKRGDLAPRPIAIPARVLEGTGLALRPQAERILCFLVAGRDAIAIVGDAADRRLVPAYGKDLVRQHATPAPRSVVDDQLLAGSGVGPFPWPHPHAAVVDQLTEGADRIGDRVLAIPFAADDDLKGKEGGPRGRIVGPIPAIRLRGDGRKGTRKPQD